MYVGRISERFEIQKIKPAILFWDTEKRCFIDKNAMMPNQQEYLISHIVDKMADYLIEDFHLDIPFALNVIYTSDTYRMLSDTENDLYSQSPSYIYQWLKQEFLTGKAV